MMASLRQRAARLRANADDAVKHCREVEMLRAV